MQIEQACAFVFNSGLLRVAHLLMFMVFIALQEHCHM